jgi:reactive intermediate/imine deaminase
MPLTPTFWPRAAAAAALLLTTACASARVSRDPQFIQPDGPPANPFSPAVRVGDLVFVSGTLGTRPDGTLVPGGIQAETRQVLENIKGTLAAAGLGMDRIVKCTAFIADLKEWPAMNEVYRSYFPGAKYPARAAVQATLLFGARVELECVAAGK